MNDQCFKELMGVIDGLPNGLISADRAKDKLKKRVYELYKLYYTGGENELGEQNTD